MRHSGGNRHKQAPISKMNQLYNTVHLLSAVASAVIMTSCLPQLVYGGEFDGWSEGRATFYGEDGGATIHQGSCMFGQLDYSKGTGWDIAAISDKAHDYAGSCGRCYEVACRSAHIGDGHGNSLDRTGSCQGQKSVTVMITDTCPCYYPSNAHSNSRWCCGDQYHMDLSKRAFEKIANLGAGAIGVYYRVVECPGTSSSSSSSSSSAASSSSSSSSSSSWGSATSSPSDQSSSSSSSSSSSGNGSSWSSSSDSSSSDWNSGDDSSSSSSSWSSSSSSSSYDHGGAGDWLHDLLSVSAQYYDHNWPNRGGHLRGHWGGHRKTLAVRGV